MHMKFKKMRLISENTDMHAARIKGKKITVEKQCFQSICDETGLV